MRAKHWRAATVAMAALFFSFGALALPRLQAAASQPTAKAKPDKGGKPPKVSWSPSRVQNADVSGDTITVELTTDQEITGATLRTSGSLSSVLMLPTGPIDIPAGGTVEVQFGLLQTPDEAGHTLGGTVHLVFGGEQLAQPLAFSLKQTKGDDTTDESDDSDDPVADDGTLPVSWLVGDEPLDQFTQDLFADGAAEITLKANRTLENLLLWLTPSLRDYIAVSFPDDLVQQEGVLELTDDGNIKLIAAGTEVPVIVTLLKPLDEIASNVGGTLHVRTIGTPKRTWPATLPFNIVVDPDSEDLTEVAPAAIVDAASFEQTPIAAGQIVSIFGGGLGSQDLSVFDLDKDGKVDEYLNGTMVLFDGYAARLLSTSAGQINAIVPWAVKGGDVELQVINNGQQSVPFPVPVGPAAPSLFTLTGTGRGQAAAVNANGTLNGNTNPARGGTIVTLFGSGAGPTNPPLADGEVAAEALPLAKEVHIFVGGAEANVLYAGAAPGLVSGVVQFNIRLKVGTPKGPQPVLIVVDGVQSDDSATVAVQ